MSFCEVQIDRLVGPTHHFGGLGVGNLASQSHAGEVSNPQAAAIQGLNKMQLVARLGVPQWILPPQRRPDIHFLRSLGFRGTDEDVLGSALRHDWRLLSAATSCSAMWMANAATVTPAVDCDPDSVSDQGVRAMLTIANLNASVHRAIEPSQTARDLAVVFPSGARQTGPLPGGTALRDEGAANHMRIGGPDASPAVNLFVYGDGEPMPRQNWPRHTLAASQAIARLHGLIEANTFFLKQHPQAIDAGAFHNDVVAMSHDGLLIHHQSAFYEAEASLAHAAHRYRELFGYDLHHVVVTDQQLSLQDAIATYLFNSQIVTPSGGGAPVIICTKQVQRHQGANALVQQWQRQGIFSRIEYVDLDQSMWGGGGPACLRLRIPLQHADLEHMAPKYRWTDSLDQQLREVIERFYPVRVVIEDLADPEFHRLASIAQHEIESLFG